MRHRKIVLVVAILAILLVVAGFVFAETLTGQQYTGCLARYGLIYRVAIGDQPKYPCRSTDRQITWNQSGEPGEPGLDGTDGLDGVNCWDLNGDGQGNITGDADNEDLNGDGAVNALDCLGPEGPVGPAGDDANLSMTSYEWKLEKVEFSGYVPQMEAFAACSQGNHPLGGGYSYDYQETGQLRDCVSIMESKPQDNIGGRPGWLVTFEANCPSAEPILFSVYAVCSNLELEPPPSPPFALLVFATSETYTGDLGGISGANQKCQDLAQGAGLPGTYKAWLGDHEDVPAAWDTYRHIPYKRVDGVTVADDWAQLANLLLQAPIDVDQNGELIMSLDEDGVPFVDKEAKAWTAVGRFGEYSQFDSLPVEFNCAGWSVASSSSGHFGFIHASNDGWTTAPTDPCSDEHHLYCFQQ